MRFLRTIRGRFLAWLAFLLVLVLLGFGATAFELQRVVQAARPDPEIDRRLDALETVLRMNPPGRGPSGPGGASRPERERGPGGPPPEPNRGGPREGTETWGSDEQRRRPEPRPAHTHPERDEAQLATPGGAFRMGPRQVTYTPELAALFDDRIEPGWYFALWSRDRGLVRSSAIVPADLPPPTGGPGTRVRAGQRETWRFNALGEAILVGRSDAPDASAHRRFAGGLAAAGGVVLLLGLGGGWVLANRALRPVEDISRAAGRIAEGNLSERIPGADGDSELGRLAAALNAAFARLEAAFARQRQFTADAAHELRTPITVLLTETQTTLARERSAAEYREALEECQSVAQQMRGLAESLLDLSSWDGGAASVARLPADLALATERALRQRRAEAEEKGLTVEVDLASAPVLGDERLLERVVSNLLGNAIAYHRRGGRIWLRTGAEAGEAFAEVRDDGVGIAPEDLPHIFERFFRADRARRGGSGHAGLGLAICRAVAEAHGGSLTCESELGRGSRFRLRLPTTAG